MLISAACDKAVGAWDEDRFFLYSEETDVAARARDAGFRVEYIPEACVRHRGGGSGQSEPLVALSAVNRSATTKSVTVSLWALFFRSAVVLHELLKVRDRAHRKALAAVLRRSTWANLPGGRTAK